MKQLIGKQPDFMSFSSALSRRPLETAALLFACLLIVLLSGCSDSQPYRIQNIAKSDVDLVADAYIQEMESYLRTLTIKLYKRNPRELAKVQGQSVEDRLAQLFGERKPLRFGELGRRGGIDAMLLCFEESYEGDRVFAVMAGLTDMIYNSYNYKEEFFLFDRLDQQKLYNSARNIEILVWRFKNRKTRDQAPFLLTNSRPDEVRNLSFERLFGKMIALQDMMARITADRTNRTINKVVHSLASATFMPLDF